MLPSLVVVGDAGVSLSEYLCECVLGNYDGREVCTDVVVVRAKECASNSYYYTDSLG